MTTSSHRPTRPYDATPPAEVGTRHTVTTTLYELIVALQDLLASEPDDRVVTMALRLLRSGHTRMLRGGHSAGLEVSTTPGQPDDLQGD